MLESMLYLFIVVTVIFFLISFYMMEEYPKMSIPFIMLGMIFSILCTYGFFRIDFPTLLSDDTFVIQETNQYGEPYGYVFMLIFFIFLAFMFRAGFNAWQDALATKNEMDYNATVKINR